MVKTLKEFCEYCNKGSCLRRSLISKICKKNYKQERCFIKWVEAQEPKKIQVDEKLEELRKKVIIRDNNECQLIKKLSIETLRLLQTNALFLINQLDMAHILGKGSFPQFKYLLDNVVLLNRYSHSMLDQQLSPVTGKHVTQEEYQWWWVFIIGEERKKYLDNLKDKGE